MPKKTRADAGIRRHGAGWQTYVQVGGVLYTETWPLDTPKAEMREWRARQKAKGRPARTGTLAADVATYLATVKHMPTYSTRKAHLDEWCAVLGGDRRRASLTPPEVAAALSAWRTTPRAPRTGPGQKKDAPRTDPLGPVAVRHRRTALRSLYVALDGKAAADAFFATVPVPADPAPDVRAVDPAALPAILAALRSDSLTRYRLAVMATTGMPPAILQQVQAHHVDAARRTVVWQGRKKGGGTRAQVRPLSAEGVEAFRQFFAAGAEGPFSTSSLYKAWKRALAACGLPTHWRPYDLRHLFGALVYAATGDLATVGRLLGHADPNDLRVTARYAAAAASLVDAAAAAKAGAKVGDLLPARLPTRGNPEE
jgi:integrase